MQQTTISREVSGCDRYLYVTFKHDTITERNGEEQKKKKKDTSEVAWFTSFKHTFRDFPPAFLTSPGFPNGSEFCKASSWAEQLGVFQLVESRRRIFGRPQRRRESPPAATSPCPHSWTPTWHGEKMAECECIHKKPLHTMTLDWHNDARKCKSAYLPEGAKALGGAKGLLLHKARFSKRNKWCRDPRLEAHCYECIISISIIISSSSSIIIIIIIIVLIMIVIIMSGFSVLQQLCFLQTSFSHFFSANNRIICEIWYVHANTMWKQPQEPEAKIYESHRIHKSDNPPGQRNRMKKTPSLPISIHSYIVICG